MWKRIKRLASAARLIEGSGELGLAERDIQKARSLPRGELRCVPMIEFP